MQQVLQKLIIGYYAFFIAAVVFFADRVLKILIIENLLAGEKIIISENFLSITKVYNTGAAFGIFQDNIVFLSVFSIIITVLISVYLIKFYKTIGVVQNIAWGFILGGAAGNFFDRFFLGHVIDFINLEFINFPVFNTADLCINTGAVLLLIRLISSERNKSLTGQKNDELSETKSIFGIKNRKKPDCFTKKIQIDTAVKNWKMFQK